jgi:predicted RNA-binding Zn-ribbon protein involved in translation (DUF1610 family)
MNIQTCLSCQKETVSVIKTDNGYMCYNCYSELKTPSKKKHDNPEARMQTEFFNQVPIFFPKLPSKLLFSCPNGGSRNIIEAKNLKAQGVKSGVTDVLLLIPKKGYANLCLEFKTAKGRQSDDQKEFQRQIEGAGGKYMIVRSVKQAIESMKEYLG